jgi:predicted alpha/beta superfamily hydrolase
MKKLSLVVCMILVSLSSVAADTNFLQGLGDTRYHRVASEVIGRAYHIYVMLPNDYDVSADTRYPTIYLLDGGALYPVMTAYYHYLNFGEEVPDSIIVGISYGGDTLEEGNYRGQDYTAPSAERDFWGGAGKFQEFLSAELLPIIENGYSSDASRRIIFGQSIGGQFVLYTALTKPNLFWGHIASNPALHRNLEFFLTQHGEPEASRQRSRLFVADGTLDDAQFREPAMAWMRHWQGRDDIPWDLQAVDLEGHTHMSAAPAAFRQGMRWLFAE